jgi:S-adenosylmethionine decarboxylase
MAIVGTEWLIDASGCEAETLRDGARLQALFDYIVTELQLHPVGEAHWHHFPEPGGITGVLLLRESHLTCHTYPEIQTLTINLYCCQARPEWRWGETLRDWLGVQTVRVRVCERGVTESVTPQS